MKNNEIKRGQIVDRDAASQIRDYSGLRWGNGTPTDIDGFMEFKDKAYVVFDLKYKDAKMPYGQQLALERLCKDLKQSGKHVLGCIVSHSDIPPFDIIADKGIVTEVWDMNTKKFRAATREVTLYEAIDTFLKGIGIKY
jgi:hypothetical protein